MKLQKTTIGLFALAIVLGGFVYFYEIQGAPQREAAEAQEKDIFTFEEEQIQSVKIERQEETLEFERTKDTNLPWQMKQPDDVTASDASVSFLLDLLIKKKGDRAFMVENKELKDYGLDKPSATVTVSLNNDETHQLVLGKQDFTENFLYAQVNPEKTSETQSTVFLVPIDFKYGVERELAEWKQDVETNAASEEKENTESQNSKSEEKAESEEKTNSTPEETSSEETSKSDSRTQERE